MVNEKEVLKRTKRIAQNDAQVGFTMSDNKLTNNLTFNLATLNKLFEKNKDRISLKQKSRLRVGQVLI